MFFVRGQILFASVSFRALNCIIRKIRLSFSLLYIFFHLFIYWGRGTYAMSNMEQRGQIAGVGSQLPPFEFQGPSSDDQAW